MPRSPRRRISSLAALLAAAALALVPGIAAPAQAAGTITSQGYYTTFHLSKARAQGLTGEGITIAEIEGEVDTSVPELAGADITVKKVCDVSTTPDGAAHATAVASILVSKNYGWAPKAKLVNYVMKMDDSTTKSGSGDRCDVEDAINEALNDGVDVINISLGSPGFGSSSSMTFQLARAAKIGVPVVVGAGNDGNEDPSGSLATANGTIGVSATDDNGTFQTWSNYGKGVTVAAPGTDITVREPDSSGALTRIATGHTGTSYSTPMVTGLIALTMQKYPKSTGNQVAQDLIKSADVEKDGWGDKFGWGLISPKDMLATDPTTLPDRSPVIDKFTDGSIHPTGEEISQYDNGLYDPTGTPSLWKDNSYVYRGTDETLMRTHPGRVQLGTSPAYHK